MVAKDLVWAMVVLTRGTERTCQSKGRSGRCEVADNRGANVILRYHITFV